MHYGICLLSVIGAMKEPSSTSEMVTQLLFGEHYTVIKLSDNGWVKIITANDRYECWINAKQYIKITSATFERLRQKHRYYCNEFIGTITNKLSGASFHIPFGSVLPCFNEGVCSFDSFVFYFNGKVSQPGVKNTVEDIISTANLYMHTPYLWGGKSPFGIDCSGFTQTVYAVNGYALPRDAYQQVNAGYPLNFVEEAQPGDLAFFDNEEGRIVHVGIVLNNQQLIHASGMVKIEKFDHYGIYNNDIKKYSHTLRVIKRVL